MSHLLDFGFLFGILFLSTYNLIRLHDFFFKLLHVGSVKFLEYYTILSVLRLILSPPFFMKEVAKDNATYNYFIVKIIVFIIAQV